MCICIAQEIAFGSERRKRSQEFILPGRPLAKMQPGQTPTGLRFDKQKNERLVISLSLKSQLGKAKLFEGPLEIKYQWLFAVPKYLPKKKQQELLGKDHIFKPDYDNLCKLYGDCMQNGVLFSNDSIISRGTWCKIWAEESKTIITVTEIR